MAAATDVLVVGAGPAGLVTALQAHAHGASVRVVERRTEPFRPSRAMILHPRALEGLRPLGVSERVVDRGDTAPTAELHLGRRVVRVELAEVDLPGTAYPHLTLVRQADVEEVLLEAVEEAGIPVAWGAELVDLTQHDGRVHHVVDVRGRTTTGESTYLAGCDGPASTVRRLTGIGWRGGPYREEIVLADVEIDGLAPGRLHVVAAAEGLLFLFALGEQRTWRLLATRPRGEDVRAYGQTGETVPEAEVRALVDASGLAASVTEVGWSSSVRLQHRLADSFRAGSCFLVGDAAHAHSPAAAQGMNTGILDAVNLGWKLGFAAHHQAADLEPLLGSYETERRPVARQVLALTHVVFFAEASTHPLPAFLRGTVVPLAAPLVPLALRQDLLLASVVRLLSQQWVRLRHSAVSVERGRRRHGPRAGDRLPDRDVVHDGGHGRLHALTAAPGIHVLLDRDAATLDLGLLGSHVTVHRLLDSPGSGLVAVRPDGHVGLTCALADQGRLGAWLDLVAAR